MPIHRRSRITLIVGTRPEAIKMAPVVEAVGRHPALHPHLVVTGQHRDVVRQALDAFGLTPDVDLALARDGEDLGDFTARAMGALSDLLRRTGPDAVLVQGDTATVAAGALAAFYLGIPVGHVEAGLRSFDLASPFPEEANRRLAACVASLHFAPTETARRHLLGEGIPDDDIVVCGNPVVDAVRLVPRPTGFATPGLDRVDWRAHRVLLATMHRRESQGAPQEAVCDALRGIVEAHPDVAIVLPVHGNPRVRTVVERRLAGTPRIHLVDPLPYPELLEVLRRAVLVLTDSGGIQEEVAALRKPVLILREVTERPEVVEAGFGELVGTNPTVIMRRTALLLHDPTLLRARCAAPNPFGDGRAGERIAEALAARLGAGDARRLPRRLGGDQLEAALTRFREVA